MHYFFNIYKVIIIFLLFTACKKEIPNPETLDPIYKDLKEKLKTQTSKLDTEQKVLEGLLEEEKSTPPRSRDRKISEKGILKSSAKIKKLKQMKRYYKIRLKRRFVESRRAYKISFSKGEPWPKPLDYKSYKYNKKLKNVNLNWQSRVPKLFKKNPNYKPPQLETK